MSSALAIASVTQVLKDLLNNGIIDHDVTGIINGNVTVTSLPPDLVDLGKDGPSQLNLFMYHVSENQGWRNAAFPSRGKAGERISNPPLALNLHYLLTAYSAEELVGEVLLGYGMQLLHENPVLGRDSIRKSLALPGVLSSNNLPTNLQAIATSKLAEQVEQVKLTLENLTTEEISKLWTAFQVKYRPTAAYMATVVLIESERSTRSALPVQRRNIYVKPFRQTTIESVRSQSNLAAPITEGQKILHNHVLVLQGHQLRGEHTRVSIDGVQYIPQDALLTNEQLRFQLPSGLPAGLHGVQVAELFLLGTPETLHSGTASNIAAFVLSPQIDAVAAENVQASGGFRTANVKLTVTPAVGEKQRILLLLNQVNNPPGSPPAAYTFQNRVAADSPDPVPTIVVPVSGVRPGEYLVRLQIDGAESPLQTDPGTGMYNAPIVTIS